MDKGDIGIVVSVVGSASGTVSGTLTGKERKIMRRGELEAGTLKGTVSLKVIFGFAGEYDWGKGEHIFWDKYSKPIKEFTLYSFGE